MTTTTGYKLRDDLPHLGGVAVTVLHGFARDDGRFDVQAEGLGTFTVPAGWIVKVEPPLPAEPPPGYYVLHYDRRAYDFVVEHEAGFGWHLAGLAGSKAWEEVCEEYPGATFTRLVPDPFGDPVDLPWRTPTGGVVERVVGCGCLGDKDGERLVRVSVDGKFGPAAIHFLIRALATAIAEPAPDGES